MTEFDIIKNYFAIQLESRPDVKIGIGDDAAIVIPPTGCELAITTDTLVSGIHFPNATSPYDIGHKSLAVNLSDLAAMGATPAWVTLALTLPKADTEWIQAFCQGFFTLANRHHVQLIGGDLTHGPLSITIQALGFSPHKTALLRSQAKGSDLIYVTGTIGDAGLALQFLQQRIQLTPTYQTTLLERFNRPEPRIMMGEQLRYFASSAIDISDGLAADLTHILEQSRVGARIQVDHLPLSEALIHTLPRDEAITLALTAGDDYELCFTIPAAKQVEFESKFALFPCPVTCIGEITKHLGLELIHQNGSKYDGQILGYQHF